MWFTSFHVRNVERNMLEVPLHRLGKGLIITKVVWLDMGRDKGAYQVSICMHIFMKRDVKALKIWL